MIACVDIPALPLQLVWRQQPGWRTHPLVIVDDDRPQGVVLWACERARAARVLPGQRYAQALALCPGVRAQVVPPEQIAAAQAELSRALHVVAPRVELASDAPGTFWLDGDGLQRIFPDASAHAGTRWAQAVGDAVTACGLAAVIVVGVTRFGTYAVARATQAGRTIVFADDAAERAAACAVPLARLEIDPRLRDALDRLGVATVGQLVRLPAGGVLERFGGAAHRLYQLAAGQRWDPLVPVRPPEAVDEYLVLDDDERDVERLIFVIKGGLERLLARLARRGRALAGLHLELTLRHALHDCAVVSECVRPATPTLDARALLRLVHLRLEATLRDHLGSQPSTGIHALRLWADDVAANREQLALFAHKPRRDLRVAATALAHVRAELGDDAVVHAVLRDGHLPEAQFGWQRLQELPAAQPTPPTTRVLVRRIYQRPRLLPSLPSNLRDDGWLLSGLEQGAVVRLDGPFLVSGGWWAREHGLYRDYHFAETRRGDCLWVYFDRGRQRWLLHGAVE